MCSLHCCGSDAGAGIAAAYHSVIGQYFMAVHGTSSELFKNIMNCRDYVNMVTAKSLLAAANVKFKLVISKTRFRTLKVPAFEGMLNWCLHCLNKFMVLWNK